MTSLNPIITIGKQITSVIMKHQNVSEVEARAQALELMEKVGIPNAEQRFDDYPFQYSGGMRQRIVIAIALSCRPKILICDEPTSALDPLGRKEILDILSKVREKQQCYFQPMCCPMWRESVTGRQCSKTADWSFSGKP